MKFINILSLFPLALLGSSLRFIYAQTIEDIIKPSKCLYSANISDHLLFGYSIHYNDGTISQEYMKPAQLFHLILEDSSSHIHQSILGMCEGEVRRISWEKGSDADYRPLLLPYSAINSSDSLSIVIHMHHITTARNYSIFDAISTKDFSTALDLLQEHVGANAVDEWGQSPLMISLINGYTPLIAGLLNAFHPKVDINYTKPSGFSALSYAVQHADASIMKAILKRGADANVQIQLEGSRGNTPLHFACMLEKKKHAEILMKYGANPFIVNQHGQTPFHMIPKDAVRSTKLYFQKIYQDAVARAKEVGISSATRASSQSQASIEL